MSPTDGQPYSEDSGHEEQPVQLISATLKKAGLKWLPIFRKDQETADVMFQGVPGEGDSSVCSGKDGAME